MGTETAPPSADATRALLAAGSSMITAVLPVFLLGTLAVFIREDLRLSEREFGAAISVYYGASALLSIAGGRISEHFGAGIASRLAAVGTAAAGMVIALFVHSWLHLVAALLLAALANAIAQPAANLILAREIRRERQGLAFGLKQSAAPAGVLIAGIAVPSIGLSIGWRWAYVLPIVFAIFVWVLAPIGRPSAHRHQPERRVSDLRTGSLALLAASILLAVAGASALTAFFVESAVHRGHSVGAAGLLITLGSAVSIVARVAFGRWADDRNHGYIRMVSRLLVLGAGGFVMLGYVTPLWILATATILVFGAGWGWPGLYQFAIIRLNPRTPGHATGVVMVGMFAGGMIGPFTFGLLVEQYSYRVAWWVTALALLTSAVLTEFARRFARHDISRRTHSPNVTSLVPTKARPWKPGRRR